MPRCLTCEDYKGHSTVEGLRGRVVDCPDASAQGRSIMTFVVTITDHDGTHRSEEEGANAVEAASKALEKRWLASVGREQVYKATVHSTQKVE
jgi:hypothetical protein